MWRRSIARCFNKPLFLGKKKRKKSLPFKTAMSGMVIITLNSMKNFFMPLSAGRKKISQRQPVTFRKWKPQAKWSDIRSFAFHFCQKLKIVWRRLRHQKARLLTGLCRSRYLFIQLPAQKSPTKLGRCFFPVSPKFENDIDGRCLRE